MRVPSLKRPGQANARVIRDAGRIRNDQTPGTRRPIATSAQPKRGQNVAADDQNGIFLGESVARFSKTPGNQV